LAKQSLAGNSTTHREVTIQDSLTSWIQHMLKALFDLLSGVGINNPGARNSNLKGTQVALKALNAERGIERA
jgi:hypothetical protein